MRQTEAKIVYDKRLYAILIMIAIGVWLHLLVAIFPPGPVRAIGTQDVNIAEIGSKYILYGDSLDVNIEQVDGEKLPRTAGVFGQCALPIIEYEESPIQY